MDSFVCLFYFYLCRFVFSARFICSFLHCPLSIPQYRSKLNITHSLSLKNLCLIIVPFFRSICDPADRPVRPSVHRPPQQRFSSVEKCVPSDGTSDKKPATVTNAAVQPTSTEYHCHKRFGAFTFHKTSFSKSSVGSWW